MSAMHACLARQVLLQAQAAALTRVRCAAAAAAAALLPQVACNLESSGERVPGRCLLTAARSSQHLR